MIKFYLVPIETVSNQRGPKYFCWSESVPPCLPNWSMMDYGFMPYALLVAKTISQAEHDALILNADVYAFPDDLDSPVADPGVDAFFEGINLPADWLTPATTYRELLRQVAGMFQFNQRYGGISGGASVFDNATLDTRLRQMTDEEQVWFLATVESFGFDPGLVNDNSRLRLLVKQAGSYWAGQSFYLGGIEF